MSDQQQIIDELIDYIDKAVLKHSVSNRHVAEVLSWLNEELKKINTEALKKMFLSKNQRDEAKETIGSSLAAASSFDRKLLQIGYLSRAKYASQKYLISSFASYRVDSTFPKILRSSISSEIVSARYDLSIAAIEPWKE